MTASLEKYQLAEDVTKMTCEHRRARNELYRLFPLYEIQAKKDVTGVRIGDHIFTEEELATAQYVGEGSMHTVLILKDRNKVIKLNKPGYIADTYGDVLLQMAVLSRVQSEYPELEFYFPHMDITLSDVQPNTYAVVMEYIPGRMMNISDIYNSQYHKQIRDLRTVFYLLLKKFDIAVSLDLMGAKQGVNCALYGLQIKDDFVLANLMITPDHKLVLIDPGLSFSTWNTPQKLTANIMSFFGQVATIEHMYAIACGKKRSFIR